jgi:hypothetical protein
MADLSAVIKDSNEERSILSSIGSNDVETVIQKSIRSDRRIIAFLIAVLGLAFVVVVADKVMTKSDSL